MDSPIFLVSLHPKDERSMEDFAAIDFETANGARTSVCSVGVVVVRRGEITQRFYSLIQPEPNYYSWFCQRVHGLDHSDTDGAPLFPDVWTHIAPLVEGLPLVAHNAPFDSGCLKAVMRCYRMDDPGYVFYDTLSVSRRVFPHAPNHQLQTIAALCGYDLSRHHHALADAEACAYIAMKIL